MKCRTIKLLSVLCFSLAAVACSSSPATTDGTSGGGSTGAATTGGGGTGTSGGGGSTGTSGTSSGGATLSLLAGDCYTFSTKTEQPYSTACGDLMALSGARVDLSNGAGSSMLCQLSGTFTSLSQVPPSYASCQWTTYVEGGDDLSNTGLIVLDSSGTHHYRLWIAANALPSLTFEFAPID